MRVTDCVLKPRVYRTNVSPPVGTLEDTSRMGNNGTMTATTWTRLPGGLWVLNFNGTTSIITVTDGANVRNVFAAGGTLLSWVNPASDGEGDAGVIFRKTDLATKGYNFIVGGEAAGFVKLYFAILFDGGWGSWETTNAVLPIGKYSLVAVTYNSSSIANDPVITVNGAAQAITEGITPIGVVVSDAGQNLIIGNNAAASATFDGKIWRPRVSRYAVTTAQIYSTFQAERGWFGV